jgi:hypothetical protein
LGKGIALPKRFFEWFMQKFRVKIALIIIYLGLGKGAETKLGAYIALFRPEMSDIM